MKQLHPVFNVVKLTPALDDPITGCKMEDHPLPVVIDGEAEWEVLGHTITHKAIDP